MASHSLLMKIGNNDNNVIVFFYEAHLKEIQV